MTPILTTVVERSTIFIPFGSVLLHEYEFPLIKYQPIWCTQAVGDYTPFNIKSLLVMSNLNLFDVEIGNKITHLFWLNSRFIISAKNRKEIVFLDVPGTSLLDCHFRLDVPLSFATKHECSIRLLNDSNFIASTFNRQTLTIPEHILKEYYISLELLIDFQK